MSSLQPWPSSGLTSSFPFSLYLHQESLNTNPYFSAPHTQATTEILTLDSLRQSPLAKLGWVNVSTAQLAETWVMGFSKRRGGVRNISEETFVISALQVSS